MEKGFYDNVTPLNPHRREFVNNALILIYEGLDMLDKLKPDPLAIFMTHSMRGVLDAAEEYTQLFPINR